MRVLVLVLLLSFSFSATISKMMGIATTAISKISGQALSSISKIGGDSLPSAGGGYTQILLHGDGDDNGTTFTDSSSYGRSMSASNMLTKTGQKVFGTASIYYSKAATSYLRTPSGTFDPASQNFTIDFRYRIATLPSDGKYIAFLQSRNAADNFNTILLRIQRSGTLYYLQTYYSTDGSSYVADETLITAPSVDTWYHLAWVRNGASGKVYINGTEVASYNMGTNVIATSSSGTYLGYSNVGSYDTDMYLDEYRVSLGIARWTANFTPPIAAYTAD